MIAFAVRGAFAWAMEVAGRRAAWSVLSELRLALVERRLRAHPTAVDGAGSAEITAVSVQGVEALEGYFARYLPQVVLASIVPFLVIAWVAFLDLEAAVIMLLTLPLVPVFMWLIGTYTADRTRERWQALRALSSHFLDVVRGLPTLRAFGRAHEEAAIVGEVSDRYRQATMETLRISFLSGSVLELAATIGVALVAVTAGVRLVDGSLGLQAGLAVIVLAPELYLPFRRLGAEYHASADGLAVADRLFALLDAPAAAGAGGALQAPSPAHAPVALERVSFSYPSRKGPVLDEFSLELSPGEAVALVGESGAGKSTVAALLLGLLTPTAGAVTVGGMDLRECELDAWRRLVAWVPQHPTLFRGTVADNIRLGDPDATDESVAQAARLAGADEFIDALPDGYATLIGDGARALSPGERRRIGLARAFVRDAPLVILDEPTADLDPESVAVVAGAVRRLRAGRTMLVIAHRPELVRSADRRGSPRRRGRGADGSQDGGVNGGTLRALLRLVPVPRWRLAGAAVLGALTVVFGVGLMATAGYLISRAAERPEILSLMVAIVAVQFFGIGRPVLRYLERLASHDMTLRVLGGLRARFYERIEPLAPAELDCYRKGDLLSRMVADVDALQNLYLRGLEPPLVALLAGAVSVGAAAAFLPAAGLVLAGGLLAAGVAVPALAGLLGARAGRRQAAARGELSAELVELLRGAPELVAFGGEEAAVERVRAADRALVKLARRDALAAGVADGLGLVVTGLTVAGVLAVAITASGHGDLNRVLIAMLALLALAAFEAVTPLGAAARELSATLAAGRRVLELTDRTAAVRDPSDPIPAPDWPFAVALEGVTRALSTASSAPRSTASASGSSPASGSRSSARAAPARRRSRT